MVVASICITLPSWEQDRALGKESHCGIMTAEKFNRRSDLLSQTSQPSARSRLTLPAIAVTAVIVFVSLTVWGGVPTGETLAFAAGVAILLGALLAFGFAVWHLLVKPLPAGVEVPKTSAISFAQRRLFAVLLLISGVCLVVGGFWDEVWHRSFGLPFGPDLLWRPHLLIYASLLIPSVLALVYVFRAVVNGEGTLQQRFRADPALGFMTLTGGLLMFLVPADPIWHTIYGEDISAWSLPHIVLLFNVSIVTMLAAAVQLSTLAPRAWSAIGRMAAPETLALIACAFALDLQLQVLATDWENANATIRARPDWLLPAIYVALAAFMGTFANHTLRRVGSATATGALTLLVRFGLIQLFNYHAITIDSWLPVLPPLIALDMWHAYRLRTGRSPSSALWNGVAATIGLLLVSIFVINRVFAHTQIGWANLAPVVVACVLIGAGGSWLGRALGDTLASENKHLEAAQQPDARMRFVSPALFAGALVFIVFFVVTAAPPH